MKNNRWFRKHESWSSYFNRLFVSAIVFIPCLYWLGSTVTDRYRIGIDTQPISCFIDYRVFLIDRYDKKLERGALYSFRARGLAPVVPEDKQLIKQLVGMNGDKIVINSEEEVLVNDQLISRGLPLVGTMINQPAESFMGKKTLQVSELWFTAERDISFDSRYWGAAHEDQIVGRAYPLF